MGEVFTLPRTSREVAKLASLRPAPVADHPMRNAYGFPPVTDLPREPEPAFEVDRANGWVLWTLSGGHTLRIIHAPQFRALCDMFSDAGWRKHFLALDAAELALSDPGPEAA